MPEVTFTASPPRPELLRHLSGRLGELIPGARVLAVLRALRILRFTRFLETEMFFFGRLSRIQLQIVRAQVLEDLLAAEPGADIVDGNPDPTLLQPRQRGDEPFRVGIDAAL